MFVGHICDWEEDETKNFIECATIDLCKCGSASFENLLNSSLQKVKLYCLDGNTTVEQDRYGDVLYAIPLKPFLKALKADYKREPYRRLDWAIKLLSSMLRHHPEDYFHVVLFGH